MQSETGFSSSHQLKSYVAYKSRLKLAARAVLSADAGLFVHYIFRSTTLLYGNNCEIIYVLLPVVINDVPEYRKQADASRALEVSTTKTLTRKKIKLKG